MNATESLLITRFVRAVCPQQKFDEYTPDAWFKLLADLNFADCEEAVTNLGNAHPFIAPAEIRAEVGRIRGERIKRHAEDIPDLDAVRDDPLAYLRTLRAARRARADGMAVEPEAQYPPRDVEKLMADTAARLPAIPLTDDDGNLTRKCDHRRQG